MNSTSRPATHRQIASISAVAVLLLAACSGGGADDGPAAPDPDADGSSEASNGADDDLDALIAAAQEEGSLTLYGAPSQEALQADATAFQEQYGVSVEIVQIVAGPLTVRADQEFQSGQAMADVLMTTDTVAMDRWYEEGYLTDLPDVDYPPASEPNYAPIQSIGQGILYNSDEVSEADLPQTWGDLLGSEWSGRIVVGSPRIGPGYIGVYHALLQDEQYGEAYFEELSGQEPRVLESPALLAQSIVSGDAAIGFTAFEYLASNIKRDSPDAPVEFQYLDIAPIVQTNVALVADGPNPAAAELFVRWMMSEDGQPVHNGEFRATSPLGEYETTLTSVPEDKAVQYPPEEVVAQHDAIIALFDRLYG